MQPVDTAAKRYDNTTIALHWATALLVATQWCVAHMIDWAPRGAPRVPMRSLHLSIGIVLTLLIASRMVWRLTRGRRLRAADRGALHVVAKATHWGLYGLMAATLTAGLALWWVRGDSWFFVVSPPAPLPPGAPARENLQHLHGLLANLVLILAGFHASAGLIHALLWRDGVLGRMSSRPARTIRTP